MWFDVAAALAEIEGKAPATLATSATPEHRVAVVAEVAAPPRRNPYPNSTGPKPEDAETLAAHLREHGPSSYGAAAQALGWGATRAWRAEAELRAAGRIRYDKAGRAMLVHCAGRR